MIDVNIKVPLSGMIHITGEPDSGKTKLALQIGFHPKNIAFVDDDVKGRQTVKQFIEDGNQFGIYHDLVAETTGMKEIQFHNHCLRIIGEIKKNPDIQAVVWDTWTRFEDTFKPIVTSNPNRFRDYWSPSGTIKGAEQWRVSHEYEATVINSVLESVSLLVITTHLKPWTVGGRRVDGKFVPMCKDAILKKATFRIWLRQNPTGRPVPVGLILKRLSRDVVTERGIRTINILPRKITPRSEDESLWDTIYSYWDKPFGNREPYPSETPDEFELSILDGVLTDDQRVALRAAMLGPTEDDESAPTEVIRAVNNPVIDSIKLYLSQNPDATDNDIRTNIEGATRPLILQARQ